MVSVTTLVFGSRLKVTTGFSELIVEGRAGCAQGFARPGMMRHVATTVALTPNEVFSTAALAGAAAATHAIDTAARSRILCLPTPASPVRLSGQ